MVEFPRNPADVNFFKKKGEKSVIEIVNCTKKSSVLRGSLDRISAQSLAYHNF